MPIDANSVQVAGFDELAALAYEEAGLVLSSKKAAMIQSRLRHRFKALSVSDLSTYCEYVRSNKYEDERNHMVSALTTNVSDFFREPHHFDSLYDELLPTLAAKLRGGNKVRIWSAGCSRGQEPYSIAMLLADNDDIFESGDCRILATDIDREVLAFASDGVYEQPQLSGLSGQYRDRFLTPLSSEGQQSKYRVNKAIRQMITFKHLNLIGTWPMTGLFDVIFCRNVVIYFDQETQDRLWPRFHQRLQPDGIIYVGHSERINSNLFSVHGLTTYKSIPRSQDRFANTPSKEL